MNTLAEIGIVLLLFSIGMEFSLKKLLEFKKFFILGGALQVFLTALAGFLIAQFLERPVGESIFLGFILSLSSSAIILRMFEEFQETDTPHGRVVIGISIFQDIIAIPMILLTPFLAGAQGEFDLNFLIAIGKGILVLTIVIFLAGWIIPKLLYYITLTRSRELFLITVLAICFSVAWIAGYIGLSLSFGAFLAGIMLSDSEYRHQAVGDILPFQDIFTSFFFVSIGMLLDINFVLSQPLLILAIAGGILILKGSIAAFVTILLGMPLRTAILVGLSLCQIGEFSFVLTKSGFQYNLGTSFHHQLFLAVALLTMACTPSIIYFAPSIVDALLKKIPFPKALLSGLKPLAEQAKHTIKDHVIIVGFGLSGRNVARSCKEANIPYVILEMNSETVRSEKQKGEPIFFGDATHEAVLHHVNIKDAKVVSVMINDTNATKRIVVNVKKSYPQLYLIVRTRYVQEMKLLYQLGADDVIPDEFGSSVEIFTRVLGKYQIPNEKIEQLVSDLRIEGYEMLRVLYREPENLMDLKNKDLLIKTVQVQPNSELAGKSIKHCNIREKFNVTIVMIKRDSQHITSLDADMQILEKDEVVLLGSKEHLNEAIRLFKHAQ